MLDDGSRRIALVATDLLWMPRHVAEATRRRVAALTGIPAEAMLLNASHNHSAPVLLEPDSVRAAVRTEGLDGYAAALPDRLAGAVFGASARLQPAAIGAGRAGLAGHLRQSRRPAPIGRRHRDRAPRGRPSMG